MNCDTFYITTYNGADLFDNLNTTYECKHDFHGLIQESNISYYSCTDGTDDALRYGMIKYNKKEETLLLIEIELRYKTQDLVSQTLKLLV